MELVPQLIWLGATIDSRYNLLTKIGDLAMEAAAWAISIQAYDLAFEWLEEGRLIVWNQILQLQTPFDDLSAVDHDLSQRLQTTARELENAGTRYNPLSSSASDAPSVEQEAQRHHALAAEWEMLLAQVREIPGFDQFMLPRKVNKLRSAARDGPVVVVNSHSSRCDALVILPNTERIGHVPLNESFIEKVSGARVTLVSILGLRGDSARTRHFKGLKSIPYMEDTFKSILTMLWSDVVKPVLDFLGYTVSLLPISYFLRLFISQL